MKRHITRLSGALGTLAVFFASVALVGPVSAQKGEAKTTQKSSPKVVAAFRDVVAKPSVSTVRVKCDGKEIALGTVVAADGYILTKFSDLKGKIACLLKDGRELEATVIG